MRARVIIAFILVATTSCDVFGPDGSKRSARVELPFCGQSSITMSWAKIKAEGADWVDLPATNGVASFTATSKVTIAYGSLNSVRVYSATPDELRDISCLRQKPEAKFLDGSVRDVGSDETFFVTVGNVSAFATPFTVFVPDGPLPIVARTQNRNTGAPQRIIVRHDVDLPVGSEIPILDFGSVEPRPFESANLTVAGISGANQGFFSSEFVISGVHHGLSTGVVGQSAIRYHAVPAALLAPGDYNRLDVHAFSENSLRELTYYYRGARDAQLNLGPVATAPSGSTLATTPCARLRATVPAQAEYSSFVTAQFWVQYEASDQVVVEVGMTKDFLGQTPATWTVETPDVLRPDGGCLLRPNPDSWSVYVNPQEGRIATYLGGEGRDGEVRRSGSAAWP